eukprot:m.124276 g.124276  ORF g.124276 m.124276 type:complete len:89 (+) comp13773_c0_seq2:487-753(+)
MTHPHAQVNVNRNQPACFSGFGLGLTLTKTRSRCGSQLRWHHQGVLLHLLLCFNPIGDGIPLPTFSLFLAVSTGTFVASLTISMLLAR